ncbi:acyltransferase family protein [Methylobacterium planeticum]|uniref:Acyltransferase family protein n=1 Tax=Methylobacterium planeticum TaxID=2615211 RepID=A0A6N6MZN7_9HYPH|nr:acyltransferase family protein [Methylobacterium planeticum]KAB1076084.1 acyltransferase family protein [Methylobacterium planeticum]
MTAGAGSTVRGPDEAMRLAWVDVAKGICILLVVMMHATLGTGEAMGGEGFLHGVVAFAKPFRIPDFFLLSGLFVGRVIDRDWRLFADRRVVHFAYFYGLWVVLQSLAKYGQIVDGAGPSAFLAHLAHALVEPYSTLWFIYLLAVFSVVTKLLRRLPASVLLAGAALLQIVPVETSSYLLEEFCARYVYFVGGYLLAPRIFALAGVVRRRPAAALAGLAAWALVEGWLAFTPSGLSGFPTLASLPGISLVLGGAGALAIVGVAALLTRVGGPVTAALRLCGTRSIVIYLAFFLPMAATRTLLVKTGAVPDIGVASLIVMAVAVLVPLAVERAIRGTALSFLFRRPRAFHIAGVAAAPPARSALSPA